MTILSRITVVFLFCFGISTAFSQDTAVNFLSLKISKTGSAGPISFELRGVDSQQQPIAIVIPDSSAIEGVISYTRCNPCSAPQLYNTMVFANPISVQIGQTSTIVKFYLTTAESSPLYLNARVFSRKGDFRASGPSILRGRIEVIDTSVAPNRIVAVDNDVSFEGGYSVLFWKPYIATSGRKLTDFKAVVYDLTQTGN